MRVDGEPVSASLFDFGLYFFHNARELLRRGSGPYFYLPKLESHLEARLWNEVFVLAQDALGIPRGTIRATVLIETILAAFEMDEILYELRDHAAGLNAGRWDYLFSLIKNFREPARVRPARPLPAHHGACRSCGRIPSCWSDLPPAGGARHRRMAAFIPSRRDPEVNAHGAGEGARGQGARSRAGFDGAWVAHPDLVPVVGRCSTRCWATRPTRRTVSATTSRVDAARAAGCPCSRRPGYGSRLRGNVERRAAVPRGLAGRLRGRWRSTT